MALPRGISQIRHPPQVYANSNSMILFKQQVKTPFFSMQIMILTTAHSSQTSVCPVLCLWASRPTKHAGSVVQEAPAGRKAGAFVSAMHQRAPNFGQVILSGPPLENEGTEHPTVSTFLLSSRILTVPHFCSKRILPFTVPIVPHSMRKYEQDHLSTLFKDLPKAGIF